MCPGDLDSNECKVASPIFYADQSLHYPEDPEPMCGLGFSTFYSAFIKGSRQWRNLGTSSDGWGLLTPSDDGLNLLVTASCESHERDDVNCIALDYSSPNSTENQTGFEPRYAKDSAVTISWTSQEDPPWPGGLSWGRLVLESDIKIRHTVGYPDVCTDVPVDLLATPLAAVSSHEMGHAVGLAHASCSDAVMSSPQDAQVSLTPNDKARMQILYPAYESGFEYPDSIYYH